MKSILDAPISVLKAALALLLCVFAAACAPQSIAPASGPVPTVADYRLAPGDKVRVIIFNEPALSGEQTVASDGLVAMPLVGGIAASGKTVTELGKAIETALAQGYLKDPRASVELINAQPYYILGEVRVPGEYPMGPGMTVLNAVAKAGGFSYRANQKIVFIRRRGEAAEKEYRLTVALTVLPGDTIRIVERYF